MRKLCHILVFDAEYRLTTTPIYNSALRLTVLAVTSLSAQEGKRNQSLRYGQYYRDACVMVSTIEMYLRFGDGRAFPGDLKLAERLIIALVDRLVADSSIEAHSGRRK